MTTGKKPASSSGKGLRKKNTPKSQKTINASGLSQAKAPTKNMSNRVLLYIDILGSQALMSKGTPQELDELISLFSHLASRFKLDCSRGPYEVYTMKDLKPEISNFSDHICISYPAEYQEEPFNTNEMKKFLFQFFLESLIKIAVQLHRAALKKHLLIRGAITQGELRHEGSKIHGSALIDAVKLEEECAVYPRTIISDSMITSCEKFQLNIFKLGQECIESDLDGAYFINYFINSWNFISPGVDTKILQQQLPEIKDIIQRNLLGVNQTKDLKKKLKWRWLAKKFNAALNFYFHKYDSCVKDINEIDCNLGSST